MPALIALVVAPDAFIFEAAITYYMQIGSKGGGRGRCGGRGNYKNAWKFCRTMCNDYRPNPCLLVAKMHRRRYWTMRNDYTTSDSPFRDACCCCCCCCIVSTASVISAKPTVFAVGGCCGTGCGGRWFILTPFSAKISSNRWLPSPLPKITGATDRELKTSCVPL